MFSHPMFSQANNDPSSLCNDPSLWNNPSSLCDKGNKYFQGNDYNTAKICYFRAIILDPQLARAHYNLGRVYEQTTEPESAIIEYTAAISIQSDYFKAYFRRSIIYLTLNIIDRSIKDYAKLVEINKELAEKDSSVVAHNKRLEEYRHTGSKIQSSSESKSCLAHQSHSFFGAEEKNTTQLSNLSGNGISNKIVRVIFLENHLDPVTNILKDLLPSLILRGFKNFYDEFGTNHNLESVLKHHNRTLEMLTKEKQAFKIENHSSERDANRQGLKNSQHNIDFLQLLQANSIQYSCIDIPNIEHMYVEALKKNQTNSTIDNLTLQRSLTMLKSYLNATENTFGVMGYLHGIQLTEELSKNHQDLKNNFVFMYPYTTVSSDEEYNFIEDARENIFPLPVHCFEYSNSPKRKTACENVLMEITKATENLTKNPQVNKR